MLVIRLFWLHAMLVMAQQPTLEDVLAVGAGEDNANAEIASPVQSDGPAPSISLEDLVGDPTPSTTATTDESSDINLEDVTGPIDALDLGEATPVAVQDPPIAPTQDAVSFSAPASVEPVVETSAAEPPAPQLTSEPVPVTVEVPPVVVPAPNDEDEQEDLDDEDSQAPVAAPTPAQTPVPISAPAPESSPAAVPAPQPSDGPAPAPVSSAAPVPASEATGGAGVFVPPAPASSEAATPEESSPNNDDSQPEPTAASPTNAPAESPVPAGAETTSPPAAVSSDPEEPFLTLVTSPGSTFLSLFTPPAPTGVLAAIQDDDESNSSPAAEIGTDNNISPVSTDSPKSPDDDANSNGTLDAPDDSSGTGLVRTQVEPKGLTTSTKIGLGVGLGVGSVVLLVVVVYIMWHRRMASGREVEFEYAESYTGKHKRGGSKGSDLEKGVGIDERQKLDWESEHDVAFDFGFVKRDVSVKKKAAEEGSVEGVLAGTEGVGVAIGDRR
ncbi:hypothetical protein QBC38DRAFT_447851 [Podospora fimiseda]|uniref:Mid2 domain-containing protein n=1 Tax=Podospora fimiseda TaxID=252190 RepID=A0AAN7BFZ0_9PEZI|nr:hypothetical protein QBC38DRAFT_447851 [Podospora fimiseda]